jgi:hypothetical protein
MAVNDVLINMLAFSASPGMFLYMIIALAIMSFFIYIFIRFFSKNRFRGISLGIFSKTIYLNDYIEKFNSELFMDFDNIAKYTEKNIQFLYKGDTIMSEITSFMESIKSGGDIPNRDTFNLVMFSFFQPNKSFIADAIDPKPDDTAASIVQLRKIMEKLYKDDFHNAFGTWINYNSIWNFINKDSIILLNTLVFNYIAEDHFKSTQHNAKATYVVYYNKLKAIKQSKDIKPPELFKQLLLSTKDDITALGDVLKETLKDEFLLALGLGTDQRSALNDIMFIGPTNNAKNDGNISQDVFTDKYCALDDDKLTQTLNVLSKMGISLEMIDNLNNAISFIDTLTVLSSRNYNVSGGMFDSSVNNLQKVVLEAVGKATKKDNKLEKYMLIHNACYTLFNELLYFKYQKDDKTVFLFHDNKETVDESKMKTGAMWGLCSLFFNLHLINCFQLQVSNAISFMDNTKVFDDEIDFITDTHVSIARLKYLIQDYFIVIQQYNDKQNPDPQDIKDFWEKRVNAFGFVVADTKHNTPRNVPESEYGKAKVNRERSKDMWEADTD